jgi:hypothetical protein
MTNGLLILYMGKFPHILGSLSSYNDFATAPLGISLYTSMRKIFFSIFISVVIIDNNNNNNNLSFYRAMHASSLTAQRQNPHYGESQNKGLQVRSKSSLDRYSKRSFSFLKYIENKQQK